MRLVVLALSCLAALSFARCESTSCTLIGCENHVRWSADLPEGMTFEEARSVRVEVCREDVCYEGSFEEVLQLGSNMGREILISPTELTPDGVKVPSGPHRVEIGLWNRGYGYGVIATWTDDTLADGDYFSFTAKKGDETLARHAGSVTYLVSTPNGPDCPPVCRQASLEGSSQ